MFKLMMVIHLILYIPTMFVILRYAMVKLLWNQISEKLAIGQHVMITLMLLTGITGIVLLLSATGLTSGLAFSIVMNLTGGVAGNVCPSESCTISLI